MNFDKKKRAVKLGGQREHVSRDQLVDRAKEQRQQREETRQRLHAARCIQKWYRLALGILEPEDLADARPTPLSETPPCCWNSDYQLMVLLAFTAC